MAAVPKPQILRTPYRFNTAHEIFAFAEKLELENVMVLGEVDGKFVCLSWAMTHEKSNYLCDLMKHRLMRMTEDDEFEEGE